jgi:hypothetical protein
MHGGTVAAIVIGAGAVGVGGYFLLKRRQPVGLPAIGAYVDPKMQQAQVMAQASPRAVSKGPGMLGQLENRAWSALGGAADKVLPGLGGAAVSAGKSIASAGGKAIAKGLKKLKFW